MNNITLLIAVIIGSIQDVARQSGFLFNLTSPPEGNIGTTAAKGQTVSFSELPVIATGDVAPSAAVPEAGGVTATGRTMTMSQHKYAAFKLTAEDHMAIGRLGAQFRSVQINNAISELMGGASAYLGSLMTAGAGLAHGTPGTDPFATDANILMDGWRTMADDRAPDSDRLAALSVLDYATAGKLLTFQKLNEAPRGTDFAAARLGMLANWNVGYDQASGILQTTTAAGGYLVNNGAGYAIGAKAITVDTGTGGFAPGDLITIAGSFEKGTATLAKYVVESATATVVTLTRGLITAVVDNAAVVRIATHTSSILAHRSATIFAARPSAELPEGDLATIKQTVIDPVTGFGVRLGYYPGWHQGQWAASIVYGGLVRRPEWVRRVIR